VTDFDAASVWRAIRQRAAAIAIILVGAGLAGCETGGSILGGTFASNDTSPAQQAPATPAPLAKIALAPVIGAPDPVSKQLASQLTAAAEKHRITLAPDRDAKADYLLRGYVVAARDKASTKVSYIWDVSDPTGKRVNRITGEEVAATVNPKDPWASVTPQVTQNIADKTASSLGSWLPNQANAAVASGSSAAAPSAVGASNSQIPIQSASASGDSTAATPRERSSSATAVSGTTTASIARTEEVAASVPTVTGAPGDGNSALAAALKSELSRKGIALTDRPGGSHKVEGKVTIGAAKGGNQPIKIDWHVKDPQGKPCGTVSQKNEIPQGSLDGAWGNTADAAAAAAAQGILELLPPRRSHPCNGTG
jgi:hypothetical protein